VAVSSAVDGAAVLVEHCADLLQRGAAGGVEHGGVARQRGLRGVQLGEDGLRCFVARRADVDAQQILRTLHVVLDLGNRLKLCESLFVVLRKLRHLTRDAAGQLAQAGGGAINDLPRAVGLSIGLAHVIQRTLILRVVAGLLLELGDVGGVLERIEQLGLLREVDAQVLVQALGGLDVAIGQHELQAGDAQVGQGLVQQRDFGHQGAALDDAAEAAPAIPGKDEGQDQHGAEAQCELPADPDVCKPVIHGVPNQMNSSIRTEASAVRGCLRPLCRLRAYELERKSRNGRGLPVPKVWHAGVGM